MNLFIDEPLEADRIQVNVSEGYQGACLVIFHGGWEEHLAVFPCLEEARHAAGGALEPTVGGYSSAIINETTEAVTHESALHWLFPDAFINQQPTISIQQTVGLTSGEIKEMQTEADTYVSVFFSFERLENYVRWGRSRAEHIIQALYDRMITAEMLFPVLMQDEVCEQSEEAMHLSWVYSQVSELSLDLTQKMDEFEYTQYRVEHPFISQCYDILVNWFCIPVR
ncbi:hypothetical protein QYZ43_16840 [Vibrio parahaemolyticus]|nr:hypothetical protein [Vibrio parahaemolyticus]MDN4716559.1 hypothetical protein [Vibrio parahaemolyticus]MDN4718901.1 hypothetical protein [Vibrio parahaemolyticus]MDN4723877.1 hypothetical protein [Vibrio parahaemolyticus]MDN4726431.1 hypothetical protein [Vibrio parahaemolyticus]